MVAKLDKVPFEDALNMTGFSKFNVLLFLLSSSIIIGMSFEVFSVSYLVPASACELGTTNTQQGLMAGVPLIGIIATSHFWGYLADTQGRKKILYISMTLSFISGALAALSPNWIVLSMLKFCSSASVSGAYALSLTLLSECTPMAKRSTLVLLTTSVFLVSTGLMAVISIPVLPLTFSYHIPYLDIQFNSWRLLDLIFCLPCAIGAIGVACSFESPKYLASVGENAKALEVLKGIFVMNTGKSADEYPVNSLILNEGTVATDKKGILASVIAQTLPLIKPPLLKTTLLLSLLFVVVFICINPLVVWLPFIVNSFITSVERGETGLTLCQMMKLARNSTSIDKPDQCSMNQSAMTMVFGISIFLALFNILVSGAISCIGRKRMFVGLQFIAGIAAISINSWTLWMISAVCLFLYMSAIINFGSLSTYCVDLFPTYVKAMAVCLSLMVGRGSAVVGINIVKSLLETNCEATFYIFGSITLVGGFIGLLLPTDMKKSDKSDEPQAIDDKTKETA